MAKYDIRQRILNSSGTYDTLHPETNADMVLETETKVVMTKVEREKIEKLKDGKRVARFTIGVSTAGWTKEDCDFLCDGMDDQEEINDAIDELPLSGGQIVLLDGNYDIKEFIVLNKANISIKGNGRSTVLVRGDDSLPLSESIVVMGSNFGEIRDLSIDGQSDRFSGGSLKNIYIDILKSGNIINNVFNYDTSIGVENRGVGGSIVNSSFTNCSSIGVKVAGNVAADNIVSNNIFSNCGILLSAGTRNSVSGNICTSADRGIELNGTSNSVIVGNTCDSNTNGIYITGAAVNNAITGNTCNDNTHGIHLTGVSLNSTITGNTCYDNGIGILLSSTQNNTVVGNTCHRGDGDSADYSSSQHAIKITEFCRESLISSNTCLGKSPEISIDPTSITNRIWGNAGTLGEAVGTTPGALPISSGGTGVTNMVGTDYTTVRPRGISFSDTEPISVGNGCIIAVYE